MNEKRKLFLLFFVTALFGICGTWAYLTYMQTSANVLSVGKSEVTIVEDFEPPKELGAGENVFKKKVQVENTGTVPCFIRLFAGFSDSEIADISRLSPDGTQYYPVSEYADYLPDGWVYIPEESDEILGGFFYYVEAVEPGDRTVPLFEKVMTCFERADQAVDFEIVLYCEAVQTADRYGAVLDGAGAYREGWREFLERR